MGARKKSDIETRSSKKMVTICVRGCSIKIKALRLIIPFNLYQFAIQRPAFSCSNVELLSTTHLRFSRELNSDACASVRDFLRCRVCPRRCSGDGIESRQSCRKNVSKRNITGLQSGHNNDVMLFNVMWNHVSQSIVKGAGDPTPSLAHLKIPDGFWPGPILK